MASDLGFMFQGMAQKKCQTFPGYTLCAKYNPSARSWRFNLDIGQGRSQKTYRQQVRQNVQQFAAKQLTDNTLDDDEFVYDNDDIMNEMMDDNSMNDEESLTDCLVIKCSCCPNFLFLCCSIYRCYWDKIDIFFSFFLVYTVFFVLQLNLVTSFI